MTTYLDSILVVVAVFWSPAMFIIVLGMGAILSMAYLMGEFIDSRLTVGRAVGGVAVMLIFSVLWFALIHYLSVNNLSYLYWGVSA